MTLALMLEKDSGYGQDGQAEGDTPDLIHTFCPITRKTATFLTS